MSYEIKRDTRNEKMPEAQIIDELYGPYGMFGPHGYNPNKRNSFEPVIGLDEFETYKSIETYEKVSKN